MRDKNDIQNNYRADSCLATLNQRMNCRVIDDCFGDTCAHLSKNLSWLFAAHRHPMYYAQAMVVVDGVKLRAAVVPESDRMRAPCLSRLLIDKLQIIVCIYVAPTLVVLHRVLPCVVCCDPPRPN